MSVLGSTFREVHVAETPIRDLGLTIPGTRLEPIIAEVESELHRAGIQRLKPRFYLSTEWGVPFGTIAVAIPFYLARPELTALHAQRTGHVEGFDRADVLRYLRHEVGHVVNYAYRLYDETEWTRTFGAITQPYIEDYRAVPFSPRHVMHLPGWYAQKHPDEDWAETFAVWLAPGSAWRTTYASWPIALGKLQYCDRTMAALKDRDPLVTAEDLDEDVGELAFSLEQFYRSLAWSEAASSPRLDSMLYAIFPEKAGEGEGEVERRSAAQMIQRLESDLMADVYRWTGHFPERTRLLLRHMAERAQQLRLDYAASGEQNAALSLAALTTALAMNHVWKGAYFPED